MKISNGFSTALAIGFMVFGLATCHGQKQETERVRLQMENQTCISESRVDN